MIKRIGYGSKSFSFTFSSIRSLIKLADVDGTLTGIVQSSGLDTAEGRAQVNDTVATAS